MSKKKKRYYAVVKGRKTGIYNKWYGDDGAAAQIENFSGSIYKGFNSLEDAKIWFKELSDIKQPAQPKRGFEKKTDSAQIKESYEVFNNGAVTIYTDGSALNNPGPGGYGTILICGSRRKELSGGFRLTTNNRMELMACIVGLKELKRKCRVIIYSDSKYVVNGIKKGWAKRWKSNNWMRNKTENAENVDLWGQLLDLCSIHNISFEWVKGHAGNSCNERCDRLAMQSALRKGLPPDIFYENGKTKLLVTKNFH